MSETNTISGTETAAPAAGQATAPGSTQAAQQGTQQGQQGSAQAQTPAISVQDILAAARPQRSPEEELELLKQQYSASSSEAKKLAAWSKRVREQLAEQGIDIVDSKDGLPAGLKATEKYSKEIGGLNLDDVQLTSKEKELLQEDPEKAMRSVIARVGERVAKAYTRAVPTIDKVVEPIAPERIAASHKFLASRKDVDGAPKYPDYEKDAPIVDQLIADLPEGIRNAFAGNETLLAEMQYARLQHIKAGLSALAQRKAASEAASKDKAKEQASVQVQGHGRAVIPDGMSQADIAKALLAPGR